MACLDTSILIDLKGKSGAQKKKAALAKLAGLSRRGENLVTTRFNIAELYVGISLAQKPRLEAKSINVFLSRFDILDFDDHAAFFYGQIKAWQQKQGKPSGDMDVLIAATAMANGHTLITQNTKHFENIPNLKVEDY